MEGDTLAMKSASASPALRISTAASLAVHALGFMTLKPDQPISARSIARSFNVSEANQLLLDRLTRASLHEISRVFLDSRIELPFEQEDST